MKINFKNLGAVKQASIDLNKRLTVLCGPNNTGKTYVSYAIYGIIEGLGNHFYSSTDDLFTKENLIELIDKKSVSIKLDIDNIYNYDQLIKSFNQNLDSFFGISEAEVKRLLKDVELTFDITKKEFEQTIFESDFDISRNLGFIEIKLIKKRESNDLTIELIEFKESNLDSFFSNVIGNKICNILLRFPAFSAHIFSVERNSIYTFSKELSVKRNMLIDEMQKVTESKRMNPFEWMRKRSTRYPLPIRDGLEIAEDIVNYQKVETEFTDFANEIESDILNGKVTLNKDGEVVFASNKAKGKKIPIHLSASVVKTLSSVIFYLKHLAKPNDLIIIDEPELNLHPDNQILLTRIFAELINKGFRVLISTHSDYIIRELNNLIMLSGITNNDAIIKELGYKREQLIKADDVGAYLFKYPNLNSTKTIVQKLDVDFDGFDVDSIDETINKLNNRSMVLYQYINEQKEEIENAQ
jgi:predicted ATPase